MRRCHPESKLDATSPFPQDRARAFDCRKERKICNSKISVNSRVSCGAAW